MSYPDSSLCPPDVRESLLRYVEHGIHPGDFLYAVLCNDLRESVGRADENNLEALSHIVAYCYNKIPGRCWGSPARVAVWIETCAERIAQEATP
jgi:hypothetical protein